MIGNAFSENFCWGIGVVEDVNDPLRLGRCRVRVLGVHSENKEMIPTGDLPWAIPLNPVTSASINGIGQTPTGLLPGSWVMVFFRDGKSAQQPVIMGSFLGIPSELPNVNSGFNDPNGEFPREQNLGESDVNRLARNDLRKENNNRNESLRTTETKTTNTTPISLTLKRSFRETEINTALGGSWSEPETPYNVRYPNNKVYETKSGHVIEIDDSPGAERLHFYHKSGTFSEIHPDGTKVEKSVGDDVSIINKDCKVSIGGNCLITVDEKIKLKSNSFDIEIDGDVQLVVGGDMIVLGDEVQLGSLKTLKLTSATRIVLDAPRVSMRDSSIETPDGYTLNTIQNSVIEQAGRNFYVQETRPIDFEEGDKWYNSSTGITYIFNNGVWRQL